MQCAPQRIRPNPFKFTLQVRELRVRDSEGVVRWGTLLLTRHAKSLSYEECAFLCPLAQRAVASCLVSHDACLSLFTVLPRMTLRSRATVVRCSVAGEGTGGHCGHGWSQPPAGAAAGGVDPHAVPQQPPSRPPHGTRSCALVTSNTPSRLKSGRFAATSHSLLDLQQVFFPVHVHVYERHSSTAAAEPNARASWWYRACTTSRGAAWMRRSSGTRASWRRRPWSRAPSSARWPW